MIRVLHVIDHLGLGGAQSALLDMVTNGDRSALQAEVAVLHGRGLFADALARAGIQVHSLAPSKWPPVYVPNLLKLAGAGGYDVLHFHLQGANWLAKPLCAAVCRSARVAHDHSSADLHFRGWWSLLPDGLAHLFSDHVVAVSSGVADFLAQCEAVPREKISVVPNGVDTAQFVPATAASRAAARRSLGLTRDQFVAGYLGRLAREKNPAAMLTLAGSCPGIGFLVGGSGPLEGELRKAARGLPNCRLPGAISDRAMFFAALDVFVLPSWHEALPMTVLEAMASGVPVLASDLEGVASAVGGAGVLVPPGDTVAMAREIESLRADAKRRAALAAAARIRVERGYSAAATAGGVEAIYRTLLTS